MQFLAEPDPFLAMLQRVMTEMMRIEAGHAQIYLAPGGGWAARFVEKYPAFGARKGTCPGA